MALALDTSGTASGNGANAITTNAITTGGSDRFLVYGCHVSNDTPSAITFTSSSGSYTWTQFTNSPVDVPGASNGKLFIYWAFATGVITTTTFTGTFTGGGNPQSSAVIGAISGADTGNSGADAIGDIDTATANFAQTISTTSTTTRANSLVISFTGETQNDDMTVGTGQTEVNEGISAGGFSRLNFARRTNVAGGSGSSVGMDITVTGFRLMAMMSIEIKEAVSTAAVISARKMLLGLGN